MKLIVNIIGAGKLGKSIGYLLVKNKLAKIGGIHNKSRESSIAAIEFIGEGQYFSDITLLPPADITLIATPDDQICETSVSISRSGNIRPGSTFIHCSGVLTSDVISAVKIRNAFVGSIHPMKTFSEPALSVENYVGTYCAMEGDVEALKIIEPIFQSIGSITFNIKKEKKSLYHAAGVFASNYLITLSQQALNCLSEAGIEEKMALKIIISLMKGTLSNIEQLLSPMRSLTGPIKRGDLATIKSHLTAFSDDTQKFLYSALGQATIDLTSHDVTRKAQLEKVLERTSKESQV